MSPCTVLEFLICHYKIHLNYPLYALECCFPYYSTVTFARFVQLLEFNLKQWQILLLNVQKKLTPLSKQVLVRQCLKDYSVLRFILDMHFKHSDSRVVAQFCTEIVVNVLAHKFNLSNVPNKVNPLLLQLMPTITSNLGKSSSLIILNFIVSKSTLNHSQRDEVLKALLKALNPNKPELNEKLLLTFDHVVASHHVKVMDDALVALMVKFGGFVPALVGVQGTFNVKLPVLLTQQFISKRNSSNSSRNSKGHQELCDELLSTFPFTKTDQTTICQAVLELVCSAQTDSEHFQSAQSLIETVKLKFPESLNIVLWERRKILDPKLMNLLVSNHNLEGVLRKSLELKEQDITNGIVERIGSEFESQRLDRDTVAALLVICVKSRVCPPAFELLFKHKSNLIQPLNVCDVMEALLTMMSAVSIHSLWKDDALCLHLFEALCHCMKTMEQINEDQRDRKHSELLKHANCAVIDILANVPLCDDKVRYVESLLLILRQYPSHEILISPSKMSKKTKKRKKSTINIEGALCKIGGNMLKYDGQFVAIAQYLSPQSKCLLLLLKLYLNFSRSQNSPNS